MVRLQSKERGIVMSETKENFLYNTVGILIGLIPWVYLMVKYDA